MHLPPVLRNLSKSSLLILAVSLLSVVDAQGGPPGGGGGPPGGGISSGGPPGGGAGGPPGGGAGGPPGGGAGGPPGGGGAGGGAGGGPPSTSPGTPPGTHPIPGGSNGGGGGGGGGVGVVGGGIRSHSCPKPHTFDLKTNPVVVTYPTCPQDDGNLFTTPDGAHWTFQCCAHGKGSKVGPSAVEPDFEHCAAKCASTPGCKSVSFSARAQTTGPSPQPLGYCQLYDVAEPSTVECGDDTHNYAFISPAPPVDSPEFLTIACSTECPFANGQQYTASKGEVFHMDCEKRHGTKVLHFDDQDTFKDCMDACSALTACHSVDYHTNSKTCYYGSHHGEPTIDALGFQSAHSLGCSGACSEKTCGSTTTTSSSA